MTARRGLGSEGLTCELYRRAPSTPVDSAARSSVIYRKEHAVRRCRTRAHRSGCGPFALGGTVGRWYLEDAPLGQGWPLRGAPGVDFDHFADQAPGRTALLHPHRLLR